MLLLLPACHCLPRGFTCKLSDFGLVRLLSADEDGALVIAGAIKNGTPSHLVGVRGGTGMRMGLGVGGRGKCLCVCVWEGGAGMWT